MKQQTRYRYEQRIQSLVDELDRVRASRDLYRSVCSDIYQAIIDYHTTTGINKAWILQQMKKLWRWS